MQTKRHSFARILSVTLFATCLLVANIASAGPPIFDPVGEQRLFNTNFSVVEGETIEFTITAQDPEDDELVFSATDVPSWASFDASTGRFNGTAPVYSDDMATRMEQQGIYDITFTVSDGTYQVSQIVTVNVLDAGWTSQTMADLVATRPITEGVVGTPVTLGPPSGQSAIQDETFMSEFGGGKRLRRITFAFTSQVPDLPGWGLEEDWINERARVYLPEEPAVENAGVVIEGAYTWDGTTPHWGDFNLAEQLCAELDIPVIIIDLSWQSNDDIPDPHIYSDMAAVYYRDPRYLWTVFAAGHFMRSADALVTVIESYTDWAVDYEDFSYLLTGLSKFGYNCWGTAAADPDRVVGFMSAGWEITDHDAYRLLSRLHGVSQNNVMIVGSPNYLGVILKYFAEPQQNQAEMSGELRAFLSGTTNDMRGNSGAYMAKYSLTASEEQLSVSHGVGYAANLGHTTISDFHSTYWLMWVAHTLSDRPITSIDELNHRPAGDQFLIEAVISGSPTVNTASVWYTNQDDLSDTSWNNFIRADLSLDEGVYSAQIPEDSTAYYIEFEDEADGISGLITSPPMPTDRDYPLFPVPPSDIQTLVATSEDENPQIELTWSLPPDADFAGLLIVYSTDEYPETPLNGTWLYDGLETSYIHEDLTEGTGYYYTAFAYDASGFYSQGSTTMAVAGTTCADADTDGYLDATCGGDDCDDTNAEIHPNASEVCNDGEDNDCDELTDAADTEDCTCTVGDEMACYTGEDGTEGIGICQSGTMVCTESGWSGCEGQILPQEEVCDDLIDNDCDGVVDPDCQQTTPPTTEPDEGCSCQTAGNRSLSDAGTSLIVQLLHRAFF